MLMPGRGGQIGRGRNKAGSIIQNGDTIPAKLTVTQRTNNLPAMYMATEAINFEEGFMSGTADEFTTLMADQSNADAGSDNGVSYGITAKGYRYGFNGKENDNEVKGEGNEQDYGMRVYDPGLGKFLSVDPLTKDFPWYTPYQFAGNTPVQAVDLDGNEELHYTMTLNKNGSTTLKLTDIKFFYEQNWFSKAMGIFDVRSNTDKLRIPERAVVHYTNTNKDYYIGFRGSKGRGNEENLWLFKSMRRKMDATFFTENFFSEDQSYSIEAFSMAVHIQDNTALYGPLTEKAWYSNGSAPRGTLKFASKISEQKQKKASGGLCGSG